jgi:hypothetical protein
MFMQMYASIRNEWWVCFRHQASFSFIPDACPGALNPGNVFIIMYNSCHPVYMKYGLIKMDGIF